MRLLFVHSGKTDYLQDALYSGLVEVLGEKSVLCSSWYKRYHLGLWQHPRNLGYVGFQIPRWISREDLKTIDAVIIASCKAETFKAFLGIESLLPKQAKIVFVDGGDDPRIAGDLERENSMHLFGTMLQKRDLHLVFKREMLLDATYAQNVFPLNFSSGLDTTDVRSHFSRSIDVAFWAVESHPTRTRILRSLSDKFDCTANGTVQGNSFRRYTRTGRAYLQALQDVKISLNYRGAGWDTLRYWEVCALGGFLISQRPSIHIPNNFEHERSIVFVDDDPGEMLDRCEYYLRKDAERERIGAAAQSHSKQFHRKRHRAITVLSRIKGTF